MEELLGNAYDAEVSYRRGMLQRDIPTQAHIASVARWLTSDTAKPSLLLYGGVGNGKTTMARAIVRAIKGCKDAASEFIMSNGWQLTKDERKDAEMLSHLLSPTMYTAQKIADMAADDRDGFERLKSTAVLIIDDFGCEPVAVKNFGTEITPVTDLIYHRYEAMITTIITTNLSLPDIQQRYGARIYDRFIEMFDKLGYNVKSYRQ